MLNTNKGALGIIFPNSYDALVPELVNVRMMASIPFASRYRMIDFILSSMTNCNINNICVMVNNNYHSLMDHLDSGREWDLVRKNGGLHIFPPFAEKGAIHYNGSVEAMAGLLGFLRKSKEKYVVLTDSNIAVNFDFSAMIDAHIEKGADITAAYNEQLLPESVFETQSNDKGFYFTFDIEDGRITKGYVNPRERGIQNFAMNIYVLERELLIKLVDYASVHGQTRFQRDVILPRLSELNVQAFKFDGYLARIGNLKSYFDENMKLLDDENRDALFHGVSIHTKVHDDNPTRYIKGAKVNNIMAADGCIIEGTVENSILFRGVKIGKGATVKNCILMQGTEIEPNVSIEYLVTDKKVRISAGKEMKGTDTHPVYIEKFKKI